MELLYFGDKGWGDELAIATLMTVAVSITAMVIGFVLKQKITDERAVEGGFVVKQLQRMVRWFVFNQKNSRGRL